MTPTDSEKIAITREVLVALGNGDHAPALSLLDDQVRVRASGPLWTRRYRGVDGLLEAYDEAKRVFRNPELTIESIATDDDGTVVASGIVSATANGDEPVGAELLGVFWFREEKIHRVYLRARRRTRRRRRRRRRGIDGGGAS